MSSSFTWTDNPMVSGVSTCDPDIVNENLMYLKNNGINRYSQDISYDKDTIVFDINSELGSLELFSSLVDENKGNPLTDNTYWVSLGASGSGGRWGTIQGTLSDQTDLQEALDSKSGVVFRKWD